MKRAFSLIEALVVSFLVLILLGTIGGVVGRYLSANQMLKEKDRGREAVALALHSLRSDCQQSVAFLSPLPNDTSAVSTLRLEILDASQPRLPNSLPTPLPSIWTPVGSRLTIEYRIDTDANLMRTLTNSSPADSQTLVQQTQGFSARHLERNLLEIQLSVLDRNRLLAMTQRFGLPMGRR